MQQKIKSSIVVFSLAVIILLANLFFINGAVGYARGREPHFGFVEPYSTSLGSETVYFTDRVEEYYETQNAVPFYVRHTDLSNSCGATAGAIVLGFYDKYYEDLIPGFTSYYPATGKYKTNDKTYIPALLQELYGLMRINVDDVGVGESDCLNGLRTYVQNKNHSISYSSLKSSSKLNESAYLNAINSNKPVLLFNTTTEIVTSLNTSSNYEILNKSLVETNHVYVGFGYLKIKYFNGTNNFRTDTYISAAYGEATRRFCFIKIASTVSTVSFDWLINAYSVSIT